MLCRDWAAGANSTDFFRFNRPVQDEWKEYRDISGISDVQRLKNDYYAAVLSFVKLAKLWGIEPVLMTQFNRIRLSEQFSRNEYLRTKEPVPYDEFVRLYAEFNELLRKIAGEEQIMLIDLDKEIDPSDQYFYDTVHLNNVGSEKTARIIAENFLKRQPDYFKAARPANG
jgi:hypothetical protein